MFNVVDLQWPAFKTSHFFIAITGSVSQVRILTPVPVDPYRPKSSFIAAIASFNVQGVDAGNPFSKRYCCLNPSPRRLSILLLGLAGRLPEPSLKSPEI